MREERKIVMRNELTQEEKSGNYNLVQDMSRKLNDLKGFEVGHQDPSLGKMIVNHNGQNFILEATPIHPVFGDSLEAAMQEYKYIFK